MRRGHHPSAAEICGESDLDRVGDEAAVCVDRRPFAGNLFEITFRAPRLAGAAQPGEFAQLLVDDTPIPLLRRPFSFSRADRHMGTVSFYLGAVGEGSRRLARFRPGDPLRILGPLGRGFSLPESRGRSILLSGGLGVAPFPLLAQRLVEQGEEVVWLNGARSEAELYPEALVPEGIGQLVQWTEDGSRGRSGQVTQDLATVLASAQRIYACGPNPMLALVHRIWAAFRDSHDVAPVLEVSIEAPMGCGFGTCLGCSIPLAGSLASGPLLGLCCRQGPVLSADLLNWEGLLRQPAHLG